VRRLLSKQKYVSEDSRPSEEGMVPVMEFKARAKNSKEVRQLRDEGMLDEMELNVKSKYVSE